MDAELRELTPGGRGGVSVLSLRGAGALERVQTLVAGRRLSIGKLQLVRLAKGGELIDEALAYARDATDVELHLHGSPPLVRRVVAELGPLRTNDTRAGLEHEARELCARAASEAAARILLDQAQGALRGELEAVLAAGPVGSRSQAALVAQAALDALIERGRMARALMRVPLVLLAGPTNAGKSTLFNLLVGHERVVVHAGAGTTRDAVRERCRIGAYAVDLVDTAGERELGAATDPAADLERRGQALARSLSGAADLVIELCPAAHGRPVARVAPGRAVILSRADEAGSDEADPAPPRISATRDPARARETVERVFLRSLALPADPWAPGRAVPFTEEQLELLEALRGEGDSGGDGQARSALERLLAR